MYNDLKATTSSPHLLSVGYITHTLSYSNTQIYLKMQDQISVGQAEANSYFSLRIQFFIENTQTWQCIYVILQDHLRSVQMLVGTIGQHLDTGSDMSLPSILMLHAFE